MEFYEGGVDIFFENPCEAPTTWYTIPSWTLAKIHTVADIKRSCLNLSISISSACDEEVERLS